MRYTKKKQKLQGITCKGPWYLYFVGPGGDGAPGNDNKDRNDSRNQFTQHEQMFIM